MLTGAPDALIKETNIVTSYWNLYRQLIKNLKSIFFNLKLFFLVYLTCTPETPTNITLT